MIYVLTHKSLNKEYSPFKVDIVQKDGRLKFSIEVNLTDYTEFILKCVPSSLMLVLAYEIEQLKGVEFTASKEGLLHLEEILKTKARAFDLDVIKFSDMKN